MGNTIIYGVESVAIIIIIAHLFDAVGAGAFTRFQRVLIPTYGGAKDEQCR